MFQFEYEKRPSSASSCDSRVTGTTDWSSSYRRDRDPVGRVDSSLIRVDAGPGRMDPSKVRMDTGIGRMDPSKGCMDSNMDRMDLSMGRMDLSVKRVDPSVERARRPLPPRPIDDRMPNKTTVPLKVWIIASASCFAVCAALVLATVVITKWGATYSTREVIEDRPEPLYNYFLQTIPPTEEPTTGKDNGFDEIDNEIEMPVLEKLSIFKNMVANRERIKDLTNKPQIHPVHDETHHNERKIEKKDKAHLPDSLRNVDLTRVSINEANEKIIKEFNDVNVPEFRPIAPDNSNIEAMEVISKIKLPEGYINDIRNNDYEEYYNDDNLYDDYMQSNSMSNYLIEKVQELHDWITTDPDFDKVKNSSKSIGSNNGFSNVLKALNESLVEGNITIVMNKLKDIYFGENYTNAHHNRKVLLNNGTDLVSFGILTLDIMLLHNIQLMAWENQETAKTKMLKDPDVFAFNALFMDPTKVEAKLNEIHHNNVARRPSHRQKDADALDLGANLFENILEVGISAARAAIHLGRAYKNTKNIINQASTRDAANIQSQLSRNIDANTHALNHLQMSFNNNDSFSVANSNGTFYTELDCVWLLYCRNLVETAKLNAPFGTMARINGMALRMLAGELSADRAIDTMLYEVLSGWSDLECNDLFPKCSKANAAAVVMDSILQPLKKSPPTNRGR